MIEIGLVGPGVLGRTLALSLPAESHRCGPVLSHSRTSSRRAVREIKRGTAVARWAELADVRQVLVCVPQRRLAAVLRRAAEAAPNLAGKRFLIAGIPQAPVQAALDELEQAGAQTGGLLPIAHYRRPSIVAPGTAFALWGSPAAQRAGRNIVTAIGGVHTVIEPRAAAEAMLAIAVVSGTLTKSLELGARRLIRAGFTRRRALEALAPLTEAFLHDHRLCRTQAPQRRLPTSLVDLVRASRLGDVVEDALCRTALHYAREALP